LLLSIVDHDGSGSAVERLNSTLFSIGITDVTMPLMKLLAALSFLIFPSIVTSIADQQSDSFLTTSSSFATKDDSTLRFAVRSRRLEDINQGGQADTSATYDYFQYDLSQFSIRYEKCQYVKMFDDEIAEDRNADSPFALKHFVIYKLCPTSNCDTCGDDDEKGNNKDGNESVVYGKYTVPVEDYLQYTTQQQKQIIENSCGYCGNCQNDNANGDDDNNQNCYCPDICYQYSNMQENGSIDASQFVECQQLNVQQNNENQGENQIYIGPRCSSSGSIEIGLFSDESCWEPLEDLNVEDMLGGSLSYFFMKHTSYSSSSNNQKNNFDDSKCLSCKETQENNNEADQYDLDDVNEMCESLYNQAAKCESETGITNGFIQTSRQDGKYENQVENEFMACTFINSLIWNSYTETGEINIGAPQDEVIRVVTKKQAISLSLLSLTIVGVLGAMHYLNRKIEMLEQSHPLVIRGEPSLT